MQGLSLGGFGRNGAWGSTVLKLGSMWLEASHDLPCSHWSPATAPQQEADAEANQETGNKTSQGSSSNTQSAPSEPASTPKEKETSSSSSNSSSTEKSKDSNSVRVPRLTVTLCQRPFLYCHHSMSLAVCVCLGGEWFLMATPLPSILEHGEPGQCVYRMFVPQSSERCSSCGGKTMSLLPTLEATGPRVTIED